MVVSVDIRPRKDANRINPSSSKNVNVAIFSVNGFDAPRLIQAPFALGRRAPRLPLSMFA